MDSRFLFKRTTRIESELCFLSAIPFFFLCYIRSSSIIRHHAYIPSSLTYIFFPHLLMSYSRAIFFSQKQPADEKQTQEILAETLLSDWSSGCNLNFQLASHSYSVRLFSSPRLNYENCPLPMYIVPHFTYWRCESNCHVNSGTQTSNFFQIFIVIILIMIFWSAIWQTKTLSIIKIIKNLYFRMKYIWNWYYYR